MFDASAKISSGLLSGNLNNFGDFDECLAARSQTDGFISGQYCLAYVNIEVPDHLKELKKLSHSLETFRSNFSRGFDDVNCKYFMIDSQSNSNIFTAIALHSNIFFVHLGVMHSIVLQPPRLSTPHSRSVRELLQWDWRDGQHKIRWKAMPNGIPRCHDRCRHKSCYVWTRRSLVTEARRISEDFHSNIPINCASQKGLAQVLGNQKFKVCPARSLHPPLPPSASPHLHLRPSLPLLSHLVLVIFFFTTPNHPFDRIQGVLSSLPFSLATPHPHLTYPSTPCAQHAPSGPPFQSNHLLHHSCLPLPSSTSSPSLTWTTPQPSNWIG